MTRAEPSCAASSLLLRASCLRSLPFPKALNDQLSTHPSKPIVPKCLQLAHNTRVCRVRVDTGRQLVETVLPLMAQHHPGFARDIVLFNFG